MTEITNTRTLEVVAAEIRTFTASMLHNIIEIGRRLCEAKELVPYPQPGVRRAEIQQLGGGLQRHDRL